jgi:hypothetical protein
MSNSLLNIGMITKESLRILKNELGFSKGVNRQYDDQFAKKGAKIGSVLNIRKPVRYQVKDGAALQLQDVSDQSVPLTVDQQKHVAFQFSSRELTLSIDEFSDRYIKPAVAALANKIDFDGLGLYKQVWNTVGTPETTPSTLATYLAAGRKLDENACPVDDQRSVVINPAAQAGVVDALKGLFQSSEQIKKQYEKGMMGLAAGFKWKMDQNVNMHTVGPLGGTPLVKTTIATQGVSQVVAKDFTSAAANRLKAGDVFTIGGVFSVNPQNRQSTGVLQQFVVTEDIDSDGSGDATIKFAPAIYSTGVLQNVDSLPQEDAAILVFAHASSHANKLSPVNLAYHKDAFVLGMADLELPGGVDMASRAVDPDAGLSIRIVRAYDINNDTFPCRLDVLYGWKAIYPELACRIQG